MKDRHYTIKPLWDILEIIKLLGYCEDYKGDGEMFRIWKDEYPRNTKYHVRKTMIKKMGDGNKYIFRDASGSLGSSISDMLCLEDFYYYCSWMLNLPEDFIKEDDFSIP